MRFNFLLAVFALSGCATTVNPTKVDPANSAGIVNQMDRSRGFFNWRLFILQAADSVPVVYALMSDGRDDTVLVREGTRRLVVRASFSTQYGVGPWEAIVFLTATVKSGRTYLINGEVRDNLYFVWLEDPQSHEKISAEGSAPYQPGRRDSAPIFVPLPRR